MKKTLIHIWVAIRHGEWYIGWEGYDGKPMFGFYHDYYDGHHAVFHLYKGYVGVSY
jgi:hypothetical protein